MIKKLQQLLIISFLLPAHVQAQVARQANPLNSLTTVGTQVYGTSAPQDLRVIIGRIVQFMLGFVGMIFIILIIMGGAQWMLSGGNEKKIAEAKQRIINAAIGITLIFIAYSIAYTVTSWLAQATTQ